MHQFGIICVEVVKKLQNICMKVKHMKKFLSVLIAVVLCIALVACGGAECTHSSAECDGKCDLCGADFGPTSCTDENADGTCDSCGKTVGGVTHGRVNLVSGGKPNFQIVVGSDVY